MRPFQAGDFSQFISFIRMLTSDKLFFLLVVESVFAIICYGINVNCDHFRSISEVLSEFGQFLKCIFFLSRNNKIIIGLTFPNVNACHHDYIDKYFPDIDNKLLGK